MAKNSNHTSVEILPSLKKLTRTWGSNVFFLDREEPLLIDGGFPIDTSRVAAMISGREGTINAVATHYHIDHEGSFAKLKSSFPLVLAAHEDDADVMEGSACYDIFKVDRLRTAYYRVFGPLLFPFSPVRVDVRLVDGQVFGGVRVIHVPGHTRGSIMLLDEDQGLLFTGDSIRNEGGVLDGPPPQFSPGIEEAYWGIAEKVLALDFEVLLPGHGEPLLSGARKAVERMMKLQGRMSGP